MTGPGCNVQRESRLSFSRGLRTFTGRCALLLACLALPAGMARATAAGIALANVKGDVQVLSAGSAGYRPGGSGTTLLAGDRVRTGRDGWVVLAFPDTSRVVLTANSEFLVRQMDVARRAGTFTLLAGMLRGMVVANPEGHADYRFQTPTAVAGIRGTDFDLFIHGQANVFFGNNGRVEVRGLGNHHELMTADTMVQTSRGLDPTQPVALDPAPALARARHVLNRATEAPPDSWAEVERLPDVVARWDITYSRYLADAGRLAEALAILQVALDLSDDPAIQADAHLERAAVEGRGPEGTLQALDEYTLLLAPSSPAAQRETALFMAGKLLNQLGRGEDASLRLRQYLQEYPEGRFSESCRTLLHTLEASRK